MPRIRLIILPSSFDSFIQSSQHTCFVMERSGWRERSRDSTLSEYSSRMKEGINLVKQAGNGHRYCTCTVVVGRKHHHHQRQQQHGCLHCPAISDNPGTPDTVHRKKVKPTHRRIDVARSNCPSRNITWGGTFSGQYYALNCSVWIVLKDVR